MMFVTLILAGLISCFNFSNCACPNGISVSGVNNRETQQIVNLHNRVRLQIARGQLSGQPRGINLKRMHWDQNLAKAAQNIANSCEFAHKPVRDNRWGVGQNLYMSWSSAPGGSADWNSALNSWINEHKQYRYPNGFSEATGHYTQVVWAKTYAVGCGYTYYRENGRYNKLYVCNYGPGGNVRGESPYNTGRSGCENLC